MRLIDADALKPSYIVTSTTTNSLCHLYVSIEDINSAPTIDVVEIMHSEWIIHFDDLFPEESSMECSVCHEEQPLGIDDNFCPNCGAKMDGGQDEIN